MHGEFKDASVDQGMHRDHAETMMAWFVPILRVESDDKMMELVPSLAEPGQQVVAKTFSVRDGCLCEPRRLLPPFLL